MSRGIHGRWESLNKNLDVGANISGIVSTDDAVPHDFGCGQVGRAGCYFTGVVNDVTSNVNVHSIWIIFLFTVVKNYPGISHRAVRWNGCDLCMCEKFYRICVFYVYIFSIWISLHDVAKFSARCFHQYVTESGAINYLLLIYEGLVCDGIHNSVANFSEVNSGIEGELVILEFQRSIIFSASRPRAKAWYRSSWVTNMVSLGRL